jgi:NADH-quinone oxidoreductase subunit K
MAAFLIIIAILLVLLGVVGIVANRNALITLMSALLVINGANIILVTLDRIQGMLNGQVFCLGLLALCVIITAFTSGMIRKFYRDKNMADIDEFSRPQG